MQTKIKTLEEVAKEINESEIGKFKQLTPSNGYYIANFRTGRGFFVSERKVRLNLTFPGAKQATSFGYFKSKQGYDKSFKNNKHYVNHYGEYIGSIILKQLGKKACKTDLGFTKIRHPYTHQDIEIEGALSHFQLTNTEMMLPASVIISDFRSKYPKRYKELCKLDKNDLENNAVNIEVLLAAFEYKLKQNGDEKKIPQIRKAIFDMCAFDILYANRDRSDDNIGYKVNQETGELNFYHLYDNEQILGMQEPLENVELYLQDENEYKKFKTKKLTSFIGIPGKNQKIKSMELLGYLLEKYPNEIIDSLNDIGRYQLCHLEELLDKVERLPKPHKDLAKKIFVDRRREVRDFVKNFFDKNQENKMISEDICL